MAELGGRVVGYLLLSHIGLEAPPGTQVLALAPLAVTPGYQGRGIGSALMTAGLVRADVLHEALVTVPGDPRYYRRFGFEDADLFAIRAPFRISPGSFMVKPLRAYRAEVRGTAIYPPTFAEVT